MEPVIVHLDHSKTDVLVESLTAMERARLVSYMTASKVQILRQLLIDNKVYVPLHANDEEILKLARCWLTATELEMGEFGPLAWAYMRTCMMKALDPVSKMPLFKTIEEVGSANGADVEKIVSTVYKISGLTLENPRS